MRKTQQIGFFLILRFTQPKYLPWVQMRKTRCELRSHFGSLNEPLGHSATAPPWLLFNLPLVPREVSTARFCWTWNKTVAEEQDGIDCKRIRTQDFSKLASAALPPVPPQLLISIVPMTLSYKILQPNLRYDGIRVFWSDENGHVTWKSRLDCFDSSM